MSKKILGQTAPAATTLTDLYVVPASKECAVSTFTACNYGTGDAVVRVHAIASGDAAATKNRIFWDINIPPQDTFSATQGWTLAVGDKISVESDTGDVGFTLFGVEVDA